MKTFKFFLASLFLMLCSVASAQQVVVTKTDGTVDTFQPNEVDSVVYKPATKYYYYAGWECPMNEEELASRGTLIENYEGLTSGTVIRDYINNPITNSERKIYSVVIPEACAIYSADGTNVTFDFQDTKTVSFGSVNYVIINSDDADRNIDAIIIKKK